ncbi:MAG: segregation/condensation protein A [Terracidiphilus sp.]
MEDKTIPWWRKALNFAMGGIRSGFGLFPRFAKPEAGPEPDVLDPFNENPEEETALTEPLPQPEIVAVAPAEAVIEAAVEPTPSVAPEILPQPVGAIEAAIEPEPVESQETEVVSEPLPEPVETLEIVAEAEPESVPEPEEVLQIEIVSEPLPEPVETLELVVEAEPESVPEPEEVLQIEVVSEPLPEPVETLEIVVEAEPETTQESIPVPEPVASAEGAPAEREVPEDASAGREVPEGALAEREVPALVLTTPPTPDEKAEEKADEKAAAKLAARQKMLDEGSEQSPFSVIVGQVYDGPLDLLLDLIRKQDIDIYDIPIATITAQFLAYVNQLKASDVDVAGEFIYTASLLIHIKSKMLLPRADAGQEDAAEDPRRELVERLLEHERFKNAAQMLQQKQMLEAATWSNPGAREFKDDAAAEPEIAADTVDLVRIFRDILERARTRPVFNVDEDSVTVGQMIQFLARRLTMEDKPVALRRLLSHTRSERALIAMFLALLELVRLQAILLRQDLAFSEIFVKKHTGFDAVMSEGMMNARDDWR